MDAGYGADTGLWTALTELGLASAAGIQPHTTVWPAGQAPSPPKPWSGRGRPTRRPRRDAEHRPVAVRDLATSLPASAWQTLTWREGSAEPLTSRFARLRACAAHRDEHLKQLRPQDWLLIEWPQSEEAPTKYWFSTLPETIAFTELVDVTKLRWRIERDYQDLKQEVGLGHYEGRGWRGFHHHATLCIAAYAFLIRERDTIPPSGSRTTPNLTHACVPDRGRSIRFADQARTASARFHRDPASKVDSRPRRPNARSLSMLPSLGQTIGTIRLHWVMDMTFRDDECRVRTDQAPANFATLRHIAHNLVRRAPGKDSLRLRRNTAAWDDEYLVSLIAP